MNRSTRALISTLSGFAALGFFVIALFYWAAIAGFTLDFGRMDALLRILIVLTIVFLCVYVLASPESVGAAAQKRSTRLTANALVASLVAIAIAVVLNVIFENVPTVRADWTAGKNFSLSDQTLKVLDAIDKGSTTVHAIAFISSQDPNASTQSQEAHDLLTEYASHTRKLTWEIVDPARDPSRTVGFGLSRAGVVGFTDGHKQEIADGITERDFTSALIRMRQSRNYVVAFMTGHGERDLGSYDQLGYAGIQQFLEQNNYSTISWNPSVTPTLTISQADVLVIAQPTKAITAKEMTSVQNYLNAGGRLMVLFHPNMAPEAQKPLVDLVTPYGIQPVQGVVLDEQAAQTRNDPTNIVVTGDNGSYGSSDITADLLRQHLATFFLASIGFKEGTPKEGMTVQAIVKSANSPPVSWLETDIGSLSNGTVSYDEKTDLPGPVDMGVLAGPDTSASTPVTATNTTMPRIVAYGTSELVSNYVLQAGASNNADLFKNSISWLVGANELISIAPKAEDQPRTITLDAQKQSVIFIGTVFVLPLLIAAAGVFVWWRRR